MGVVRVLDNTRQMIGSPKNLTPFFFPILCQYSLESVWAFFFFLELNVGREDVHLISENEQCKPGLTIHK